MNLFFTLRVHMTSFWNRKDHMIFIMLSSQLETVHLQEVKQSLPSLLFKSHNKASASFHLSACIHAHWDCFTILSASLWSHNFLAHLLWASQSQFILPFTLSFVQPARRHLYFLLFERAHPSLHLLHQSLDSKWACPASYHCWDSALLISFVESNCQIV